MEVETDLLQTFASLLVDVESNESIDSNGVQDLNSVKVLHMSSFTK